MLRLARIAVSSLALASLCGCTLFPEIKNAPLSKTTSAERTNQILWDDIGNGKWEEVNTLLGAQLAWSVEGNTLTDRDAVIAELKMQNFTGVHVSDAVVKGNGESMTVLFTLQWSSEGKTRTRKMLSVWHHVNDAKAATPYLLTVMARQGQG